MADDTAAPWTPGPWVLDEKLPYRVYSDDATGSIIAGCEFQFAPRPHEERAANARLIAAAPTQDAALNYVADMTYCGADCEWHFKKGYDPQIVLDALALARGETP